MFSCQFNGPKTALWVFRIRQATPFGLTFGAPQPGPDATSSIFLGTAAPLGNYHMPFTVLRTSQYATFAQWVQGTFNGIFAGQTIAPAFFAAFKETKLIQISATEFEVQILFDLPKLLLFSSNLCSAGLKFVSNPNAAQIALLGGSANPDDYVRVRNLFGPAGPEWPTSGTDAWAIMCCDPPPEEPTDPRAALPICSEVIPFDCEKSAPGIRRVLVLPFGLVNAPLDELERVSELDTPAGVTWRDLQIEGPGSSFNETKAFEFDGTRWVQQMQLQHLHRKAAHRLAVERLMGGTYSVLFQDENSRWWLLGRNYPVKASAVETKTDTYRQGANNYVITLQTADYHAAYEVPREVIDDTPIDEDPDCEQYVGPPMAPHTLYELRNCLLYDLRNNNLS